LQVGQKVFAIGNPFGLDHTLSTGVISGLNREILSPNERTISGVVQTDAAINPGNSGGPLLDSAGRLIGMNTAIASPTHANVGIGFAVPVDTINQVVPSIIRKGRAERPMLGVRPLTGPAASRLGVRGVVVDKVDPGSAAEKAGLRSLERDADGRIIAADIILAVAGSPVETVEDIWTIMGDFKAGDSVKVELARAGRRIAIDVRLQATE
jgi:S1-C subfamily serine protease